ncbi:hypothetical protein CMV_013940 [Castanea mollissima]|uniref:Phytocyanin domain-containing protein n=1 Tax=Castanea mollissima TaxID=60419 RepID=A0A8J4VLG2_9ROSI|nr:hypothetical protein CMV_013940 [Castanea mollissima]
MAPIEAEKKPVKKKPVAAEKAPAKAEKKIMNSFIYDIFEKLAQESLQLAQYSSIIARLPLLLLVAGDGNLAVICSMGSDLYQKGNHNVLKVNGTGFQQCVAPAGTVPLTSGNDVIPLTTSGRKWYICGVPTHCANGKQKLAITVLDRLSPAPSPTLTSAAPSPKASIIGGTPSL